MIIPLGITGSDHLTSRDVEDTAVALTSTGGDGATQ